MATGKASSKTARSSPGRSSASRGKAGKKSARSRGTVAAGRNASPTAKKGGRPASKSSRGSGPAVSGRWTDMEVDELRELASHNTPTRVMGIKLGRSESSIYSKASNIGLSLKPVNRSPYG